MINKGYAIITGGSRGIGEAMCLQMAKEGYNIVINYVSDSSTKLAEKILAKVKAEYNVRGITVQGDVSDYESCQRIMAESVKALGTNLAVLVNNAGIAVGKPFLQLTPEEYNRLININLTSVIHMTHVAAPYMVEQKKGCIVNISSIGGIMGVAHQADYSAAKAGVIGFTKALAKEFGQYNIRVNAIAPGMIMTDMVKGSSPEEVTALKAMTPLGMIGEPEEIAKCLSYVVEADFLTGQTISPNGGLTI